MIYKRQYLYHVFSLQYELEETSGIVNNVYWYKNKFKSNILNISEKKYIHNRCMLEIINNSK